MSKFNDLCEITGNTFPVKDQLKKMGAKWNADQVCWMIKESKWDAAQALVTPADYSDAANARTAAAIGASMARSRTSFSARGECQECGSYHANGRCNA